MDSDAVRDAQAAVEQLRARHEPVANALALIRLGRALAADGQAGPAADAFEAAAAAAGDADPFLGAEALANAAVSRYHGARPGEALARTGEAVALFDQLGDGLARSRVERNGALVHRDLGEWELAAAAIERAERFAEAAASRPVEDSSAGAIPDLLGDQPHGWAADDLGQALERDATRLAERHGAPRALPAWFAAFSHFQRTGDDAGRYRCTVQLAAVYQQLGRWPDAHRALVDAQRVAPQLGTHDDLALLQASLAATELALGRFDRASSHADAAVAVYRTTGNRAGLGRALVTAGQCRAARGDHAGAAACWDEADRLLSGNDPDGRAALHRLRTAS